MVADGVLGYRGGCCIREREGYRAEVTGWRGIGEWAMGCQGLLMIQWVGGVLGDDEVTGWWVVRDG